MPAKSVNILCVNKQSLSQRVEINEKESLQTLKLKMGLKEARFVYGGKELSDDEDLYTLVLEGTTVHVVVTGEGNPSGEDRKQGANVKENSSSSKIPQVNLGAAAALRDIEIHLAPMFSLEPIAPQILIIDGIRYKVETGPAIQFSIPRISSASAPPQLPIRDRLAALNPGITLDIFWIIAKLSFAVYFLSRGANAYRTAILSISAFIIFLYQARIIGVAPARVPPPIQPEPPQEHPDVDIPNQEPQIENENLPPYDNAQQPRPAQAPVIQPRTLLGRVSFLALSFFASMIPGQPLPDYGLLQ